MGVVVGRGKRGGRGTGGWKKAVGVAREVGGWREGGGTVQDGPMKDEEQLIYPSPPPSVEYIKHMHTSDMHYAGQWEDLCVQVSVRSLYDYV